MKYFKIIFVCFILSLIVLPTVTDAKSVVWSQTFNTIFPYKVSRSVSGVENPNIQVSYSTRVVNLDTGKVIACGSSVDANTRVGFQFIPHKYTDIAWFGTGTIFDSPYGDWVSGAGPGSGSICVQKNDFKARNSFRPGVYLNGALYAKFNVHPPTKSISGLPAEQCRQQSNGNYICTPTKAGRLNASFNFSGTYGKFYVAMKAFGKCMGSNTPSGTVNVGAKSISCHINVNPPPPPPLPAPKVTSGACVVGQPASYTITPAPLDASKPDTKIRYFIDWNSDGKIDQIDPPRGYADARTPRVIEHVWNSTSPSSFKVSTQTIYGQSAWTSHAVKTCQPEIEDLKIDPTAPLPPQDILTDEPVENLPDEEIEEKEIHTGGLTPTGVGPEGEILFTFTPKITNTTCRASWGTRNVESCAFFQQNLKVMDIDLSGEMDLEPGTYELRCLQTLDGKPISVTQSCVRNPIIREI